MLTAFFKQMENHPAILCLFDHTVHQNNIYNNKIIEILIRKEKNTLLS